MARRPDRPAVLECLHALQRSGGVLALAEVLPGTSQRLSELIEGNLPEAALLSRFQNAEQSVYEESDDAGASWNVETAESMLRETGYIDVRLEREEYRLERTISAADLDLWLDREKGPAGYAGKLESHLGSEDVERIGVYLHKHLAGKTVSWRRAMLFIYARKG